MGHVALPAAITTAERSQFAAGLDELVELMTSMLAFAVLRQTGRLPSFRTATSATTSAICAERGTSLALPEPLVFEDRFVRRMLTVWDAKTCRVPEDSATYLHVTQNEYVVGIASRDIMGAIERFDADALLRGLQAATRVIAVWHGGR
jgi:hypothetical protein